MVTNYKQGATPANENRFVFKSKFIQFEVIHEGYESENICLVLLKGEKYPKKKRAILMNITRTNSAYKRRQL